ncbi:unnamed protein product [Phytophthora fragariaefolia]|uniref:Unnamed protein product n=1 Tax=Phytophthora fragariaefolia TaxID=1490495 RepID=A0A9W6WYK8_9STRA|nr:unnamed protein product [Phytophthora fragariaefolia]
MSKGHVAAGSAHVGECAGVVARANKSGRVGSPTTQGVVAGSARATEDAGAGARATTCGRAGAPTSRVIKGDKVTSTPKAEASSRDADSAAEDRAPQVIDAFTGEPKVGEALTPSPTVAELLELEELSYVEFLDTLKAGELAEVVLLRPEGGSLELNSSSVMDSEVLEDERTSRRQTRYGAAILKDPSDPYHPLLKAFSDVVSDDPPSVLPPDRGVRHEIDLGPGTKFCTTRQWPLPKEQVDVIDAFFAAKHAAGMLGDSKSPHSSPTFCVRKPNGKWRMVHAFNKLNAATIPASTPIPQKDVLQNNMAGCTVFSALDMVDGYYQLLIRESDIPLTAVSTPSGMLWEWLVMPQGLSNAPATFNRLVTQLFRPMRHFLQTYFDDIFVHSRASEGKTAVEAHLGHLRKVLLCMRANHLYANINKVIFGAEEIPFLDCFLGKDGVRADPEKVCAIAQWPVSISQKDLRKWLGLANYLHKYSANYADMASPLTNLLKKDAVWPWTSEAQQAFEAIKSGLQSAPILALPDEDRPFSVVCDASDFAIGCALLQVDAEGRERVVSFQSRQLKTVEKNYPVHDKELLAMKYALAKFRVHLLGQKPFVIYTDHASLRTATSSPHLSQRMARWLSFFATYDFTVEYKPGNACVTLWRLPKTLRRNRVIAKGLNTQVFQLGDQVLLNAKKLPTQAVSAVGSTKLRPRFVGPFTVIGVHGHAYTLDLPSSMATHPTFYVGSLKPYRPVGAAEPAGSTASPSTDGRRPPSPERSVPREPGQERESERQLEPLYGVRIASPSGPPGHTDYGSRRGVSLSLGAPLRRSPRIANIGPAGGRLRHQNGLSAPVTPTHGLTDGLSPGGHPGASPGGSLLLGRERAAPPSQSAGHPAVVDRTPNRPEGSPGQDEGQSVAAVRPGRTPLPLRAPPPLLGSEGALYYHVEKLLKRRGRSGQSAPTSWSLLRAPTNLVGADRAENTPWLYRLRLPRLLDLLKNLLEDDTRHGLVPFKKAARPSVVSNHLCHAKPKTTLGQPITPKRRVQELGLGIAQVMQPPLERRLALLSGQTAPTGARLGTCRTAARLGQASGSGEEARGTPPESRTPSSPPALVMTWGSGVAGGGSSRRDRASSKARAIAATVFVDIGLPG